jgi:DNA-binding MarR family transcriptional regulator
MRSPALSAWIRIARVFQKVDRASSEQLRSWGLSVAQFDVLTHVGIARGLTQQELADRLLVTKGNICQLLDRMEQNNLLERRQEGRANHLFLTEAGQRLFAAVVPAHEEVIVKQFAALSRPEQFQLLALVRKLDRAPS